MDKKPAKKEGKEVVSEKKTVERSMYPVDGREYCYLNENKLHKARKELLAVKVVIEWVSEVCEILYQIIKMHEIFWSFNLFMC